MRLGVTAAFVGAFLAAALLVFSLASALGAALQVSTLSATFRETAALVVLAPLALADVLAFRRKTYCPLTWRRQTPKSLMRRYTAAQTAAAWGFDTGLAVTTFRVAALTWAALLYVFLGLARWWTGVGYGAGFVLPATALMWWPRIGEASRAREPIDPGLEALLRKRALVQLCSVGLLTAAGLAMALELLG